MLSLCEIFLTTFLWHILLVSVLVYTVWCFMKLDVTHSVSNWPTLFVINLSNLVYFDWIVSKVAKRIQIIKNTCVMLTYLIKKYGWRIVFKITLKNVTRIRQNFTAVRKLFKWIREQKIKIKYGWRIFLKIALKNITRIRHNFTVIRKSFKWIRERKLLK